MKMKSVLSVANDQVEWGVDTMTSYHAIPSREMLSMYKMGDYGTIKMM